MFIHDVYPTSFFARDRAACKLGVSLIHLILSTSLCVVLANPHYDDGTNMAPRLSLSTSLFYEPSHSHV